MSLPNIEDTKNIGQFLDEGEFSISNEACGLAGILEVGRNWLNILGKTTLNDLIKISPLVGGYKGLSCLWVVRIATAIGIDAVLINNVTPEFVIKSISNNTIPELLLDYSAVPRMIVEDKRFEGEHFENAIAFDDRNVYMNDCDRTNIYSDWGTKIPYTIDVLRKALLPYNQGILHKGILETKTISEIILKNDLNLRIQPYIDSYILSNMLKGTKISLIEPIADKPQTAFDNTHKWTLAKYEIKDKGIRIGYCAAELLRVK